jgi:SAM-dependent methyltransferase
MSLEPAPPSWKLPRGVNSALWSYTHSTRLAEDEDAHFAGHPLLTADRRILDDRFTTPGSMVDLGCGAGRLALHFARRSFEVSAVDLSAPMLQSVARKSVAEGLRIRCVQANLCTLGCFPDRTFAYGLSMFSTLGMIRGVEARRQALAEIYRILRPGGRLALHVHNLWLNLRDWQGRRWLAGEVGRGLLGAREWGDRMMTYRGIPGMEVHLYRRGEIRSELHQAGFRIDEMLSIDAIHARPITASWFWPGIRAGGWIIFARRPSDLVIQPRDPISAAG